MKRILLILKNGQFLIYIAIAFVIMDMSLAHYFDKYIINSGNFPLNDYEITLRDHPQEQWNKVFFGNSAVISAYREGISTSGYINFGVDYGSMTGLLKILKSNKVDIGSDLVVGINWAAMFDNMETNPNYYWNRDIFEPYSYFQRDRLYKVLVGKLESEITDKPWANGSYVNQTKSYYHSSLSDKQLLEKVAIYQEKYWSTGLDGCSENLKALRKIIQVCNEKGTRLRVVMMPWNPVIDQPELISELDNAIMDICNDANIELLDLSDAFDAECFYDLGHLNYEYGSYKFTEEIDEWLKR